MSVNAVNYIIRIVDYGNICGKIIVAMKIQLKMMKISLLMIHLM
jgi:hypothetical protein